MLFDAIFGWTIVGLAGIGLGTVAVWIGRAIDRFQTILRKARYYDEIQEDQARTPW